MSLANSAPAILFDSKVFFWVRTGSNLQECLKKNRVMQGRSINAVLHFFAAANRIDRRNSYFVGSKTAKLCCGHLFDRNRDPWPDENVEEKCCCQATDRIVYEDGCILFVLNRA
jgi:hypothetical protein